MNFNPDLENEETKGFPKEKRKHNEHEKEMATHFR